ncbi:MAG: hypothetical protein M0R22_00115 [Dehalococcoidia bacterium]|jgi:hypothetical protein|nr:hypothetical protein [Dehalococcoidia bacterium]
MREEMLQKLDRILARAVYCATHPGAKTTLEKFTDEWQEFRAELHAERCENCAHSRRVLTAGTLLFRCNDTCDRCVKPDFCCSHFEKRTTP